MWYSTLWLGGSSSGGAEGYYIQFQWVIIIAMHITWQGYTQTLQAQRTWSMTPHFHDMCHILLTIVVVVGNCGCEITDDYVLEINEIIPPIHTNTWWMWSVQMNEKRHTMIWHKCAAVSMGRTVIYIIIQHYWTNDVHYILIIMISNTWYLLIAMWKGNTDRYGWTKRIGWRFGAMNGLYGRNGMINNDTIVDWLPMTIQ